MHVVSPVTNTRNSPGRRSIAFVAARGGALSRCPALALSPRRGDRAARPAVYFWLLDASRSLFRHTKELNWLRQEASAFPRGEYVTTMRQSTSTARTTGNYRRGTETSPATRVPAMDSTETRPTKFLFAQSTARSRLSSPRSPFVRERGTTRHCPKMIDRKEGLRGTDIFHVLTFNGVVQE